MLDCTGAHSFAADRLCGKRPSRPRCGRATACWCRPRDMREMET